MSGRVPVGVAVVLLALLVGCTSEDPPAGLPPSAPSTTETAPETTTPAPTTPTATGAPTVPAEAQEQTPDGAAAFVRHWFDSLTYSWNVMDSAPIRALGECLTCVQFAETIDSVDARGNHLEGNQISVRNLSSNAILEDGSTFVTALFDAPMQNEVDPQGVVVETIEGAVTDIQYFFDLAWTSQTWKVTSIRLIE